MAKKPPKWAQKALKEQEEKGKGGGDFLTLKDGTSYVRILPSWRGEGEQFYREGAYHYKIGTEKKTVSCARLTGKKCFICEEADRFFKAGDKDAGKELRAKARYFANAIDLTSKDKKVQTLAFGSTILKSILRYLVDTDDEWGEWWNEDGRYDFKIEKSGKLLDTEYVVFATRKFKDVETDGEPADLDSLAGEPLSYGKMKALYEGDDPDDVEDEPEEDDEEVEEKPKKKKVVAKDEDDEDDEDDEKSDDDETSDEPEEKSDDDESDEKSDEPEDEDEKEEEKEEDEDEKEEEKEDDDEEEKDAGDDAPECFEDPIEHDPKSPICKECDWRKECRASVEAKLEKSPKKYAGAPLLKIGKPGKVEEELKRAVKKTKGRR